MLVAEGLEWKRIYWVRGELPRNAKSSNAVSDPPCSGWQHAFVMPGEKYSTIFCPYSFEAYTVPNHCVEIAGANEPDSFRQKFIYDLILRNWKDFQALGWQKNYDTCTLILKRLDLEVPEQTMKGGADDNRRRGGKETGETLIRPVKAQSKRGKFLQWFLDGSSSRSIRETMAEFSMTRSNALSYLFMLQKDHGIGYVLVGGTATIQLPGECTDPFNEVQSAPEEEEDDDSWLD
jgi:hypothetical protein